MDDPHFWKQLAVCNILLKRAPRNPLNENRSTTSNNLMIEFNTLLDIIVSLLANTLKEDRIYAYRILKTSGICIDRYTDLLIKRGESKHLGMVRQRICEILENKVPTWLRSNIKSTPFSTWSPYGMAMLWGAFT